MLLSPEQFFAFVTASLLITLTPGPDNLMVLSLGVSKGRMQGVAFGLGCALGCLSHTLLAALGIGAVIAASAWGLTALTVAGGSYLVYLGVQAWRASVGSADRVEDKPASGRLERAATGMDQGTGTGTGKRTAATAQPSPHAPQQHPGKTEPPQPLNHPWALFRRGLLANAINPKVVIFFLAFLPQFIVPSQDHAAWQIVQLGLVFTVQAALLFGLLGYFSGVIGQWLGRRPNAGRWLDRMAGSVFIALGFKLIVGR